MGLVYNNGELKDEQYPQKQQEYIEYISNHKKYVIIAFVNLFKKKQYTSPEYQNSGTVIPSWTTLEKWNRAINEILPQEIINHDNSKFSEEEFEPYRRKWFPTDKEKLITDLDELQRVEDEYQEAWKHHYTVNDHHPDHWNKKPMTLEATIHMICDWTAMSLAHNESDCINWFNKDAKDERIALNLETLDHVRDIFHMLYGFDRNIL